MAEKDQTNRWRCTVGGCNPVLIGQSVSESHRDSEDHRIAKWPIRSKIGKKKAVKRSRSGYYDQYNIGPKSYAERGHLFDPDFDEVMQEREEGVSGTSQFEDAHIFSDDALGQD
jgi:hypothetical protein